MTTPNITPQIHLSMAAIMKDMVAIDKARENEQQHFKFRGIEDIMNELHPIFAAHGVVCVPFVDKYERLDAGLTKSGNMQSRVFLTMGYRFTATDGSVVEAKTIGEAMDSGDKATAKASSVALKYALMQTFLIPTTDLVEADYYSPTVDARAELAIAKKDRAAMQAIMEQHLKNAETAEGERKKELLGLAAEMRCHIAEADAPAAPATPAPVEGTPVTPVAVPVVTETLPPETKKPRAKKERPTPQEAAPQDTALQDGLKDAPSTNSAADHSATPSFDWQKVVCHIGKAASEGGKVNGKTLGELFIRDKAEITIKGMVDYFQKQVGNIPDPTEKDEILWFGVQAAEKQWREWQKTPTTPATTSEASNGTNAAPAKENEAGDPATLKNWRSFKIENPRHPEFHGRTLEDMSTDELQQLRDYASKIDMDRATPYQKSFVANMSLAMDALANVGK